MPASFILITIMQLLMRQAETEWQIVAPFYQKPLFVYCYTLIDYVMKLERTISMSYHDFVHNQ
jgi:hypothetical protein